MPMQTITYAIIPFDYISEQDRLQNWFFEFYLVEVLQRCRERACDRFVKSIFRIN